MSRFSVWFLYSIVVTTVFAVTGRLPDATAWVFSSLLGAASALFIHWICAEKNTSQST